MDGRHNAQMGGSQDLAGRVVLVVEDDYFIAKEVCVALRKQGATVVGPASHVEDARLLANQSALDCAVLDVNLQGEAIFELASELRARGVPTIFATGYDAAFLPAAFGDSVYLQKPINLAALFAAVRASSGMGL